MRLQTYLSLIQDRASTHPDHLALQDPVPGSNPQEWRGITYSQLLADVETAARYWLHKFKSRHLQGRSVIAVWLKGFSYSDIVHLWGISRAGYVPLPIALRMADPKVLLGLFERSGAVAVVVDPKLESSLRGSGPIAFPAPDILQLGSENLLLPEEGEPIGPDDIQIIFHTSGSTSGTPKLVPVTTAWLDSWIQKAKGFLSKPDSPSTSLQNSTIVAAGSFCHVATMAIFVAYIDGGGCLVLPSTLPYSAEELKWMTSRCGLTTLNMFSGFLSKLFTEARVDDSLLQALQAFDHVIYSGLPLPAKDEHWAQEQGINMMNVFGSTEAGPMLRSPRTSTKQASLGLTPFPTTAYKFIPASDGMDANNIFELVITAQSPDCPHPTLRNSETGDFHTGDLFTKCKNGNYLPAGRLDDWIKLESAVRCDTQSLEQKVTETCGEDLVDIAIVIGTGRPLPVLVVEPKKGVNMSSGDLQAELLRRIGEFQSQRYIHERIDSPDRVLVVPNNSIPRVMTAKGSLRRQDVEDAFQETLNTIFTHSS